MRRATAGHTRPGSIVRVLRAIRGCLGFGKRAYMHPNTMAETLVEWLVQERGGVLYWDGRTTTSRRGRSSPVSDGTSRFPLPPREIAFSEQEVTVTIDAIERRLEVLRQRAATTAEASSEGLFLAESIRQLAGARDKLRTAPQRP